jgi:hypothetical protein
MLNSTPVRSAISAALRRISSYTRCPLYRSPPNLLHIFYSYYYPEIIVHFRHSGSPRVSSGNNHANTGMFVNYSFRPECFHTTTRFESMLLHIRINTKGGMPTCS